MSRYLRRLVRIVLAVVGLFAVCWVGRALGDGDTGIQAVITALALQAVHHFRAWRAERPEGRRR
ncbi:MULTISPECIES: hypothetical protein [unclassified Streptomyces]|uniref:hypothetical protein n=1 Tax=unclassified Streptomyces TaxID=2593676 RepID=UPI00225558CB|nr:MULTISPECIES: hypothetical protein [unclassified Streptomyces]MCX4834228.1 hypothetical protein [Streptomyces sp. NBC_01016]